MANLSVNRRNDKHINPVSMTLSLSLEELAQLHAALWPHRSYSDDICNHTFIDGQRRLVPGNWITELLELIHPRDPSEDIAPASALEDESHERDNF